MDAFLPLLRCPLCRADLRRAGATLRCAAGHAFDLAHEGYVNLLGKGLPGDSAVMLQARRAFLARGGYAPLATAVATQLRDHLATWTGPPPAVLDAGCGEGYYLGVLGPHLVAQGMVAVRLAGMDIAKEAVRLAARAYPVVAWVVADSWGRLPVAEGVLAGLLDIFAPRNPAEFARILAPGGLLLVVIPGPTHLAELRSALPLLGIEDDKEARVQAAFAADFTPMPPQALDYRLQLDSAALAELVAMTPSARHLSAEGAAALAALAGLTTTVSFRILPFVRKPSEP